MSLQSAQWPIQVSRKILTITSLALIGFIVGAGCVVLPPTAPFALVSLGLLLLLWVMPDLRVIPDRLTHAMITPFFFSMQCIPVFYAIILPGLPWLSMRRMSLFALIIPLCLSLSGSGSFRTIIVIRLRAARHITMATIGLLSMFVISTPFAVKPIQSLNYNIVMVATTILPLLAVVGLVAIGRPTDRLFRLAIFCATLNFIIGLIEHQLRRPFLIYLLPSYMKDQIIAQVPLAYNALIIGPGLRGGMYRAASTFSNSLTWGEMSAMMTPISLHFVAHGRNTSDRFFGISGTLICTLSVFLSGSRGAYVGLIVAVVSYSIIWAIRTCSAHPERLAGKIWATLYTMGSGLTLLMILFVPRIHNMVLGGGDAQASTEARYQEWALAKPKIMVRPFFGYGGGSAADVIHFTGYAGPDAQPSVDSYILNLLVDYGIPGLLFFSAIFFLAIFVCVKGYIFSRTATSAVGGAIGTSLLAFVVYRVTLSQSDSLPIAFMLVGLAIVYNGTTGAINMNPK